MATQASNALAGGGRQPRVLVDRAALRANWRLTAARAPGARTGAAVKANGYGLGAPLVAAEFQAAGCRDFFVAWASEGAELRASREAEDARIFVLQGIDTSTARLCGAEGLTPVLSTPDDIRVWREAAGSERPRPAALQLETGMNRLGLDASAAREAAELVAGGELPLALVMSHLASADDPASPQSARQLAQFRDLAALFPGVPRSLANSAGIFRGADYHFDLTRPGIALYGGEAGLDSGIRPVASLIAHVLQVRTAPKGEAAGYGATARLGRDTRIATVGLGYADGYPRSASGVTPLRGEEPAPQVFLAGRLAPILGRVSMDLALVDVTDLPEGAVRPGNSVEFFGANVPIDAVARSAGTIAYELLTSLGPRVARVPT